MIELLFTLSILLSPATPCDEYLRLQEISALGIQNAAYDLDLNALIEQYPACDPLHSLKLRFFPEDPALYSAYFRDAAQDPVLLTLLLERYEDLYPYFPKQYQNPLELLERLLWANNLSGKAPCPCETQRNRVHFRGYMDEISSGCYKVTIFCTIPPLSAEHTLVLSFDDPFLFALHMSEVRNMLKNAEIELLHRFFITDKLPDKAPEPGQLPRPRRR